MTPWGILPSSCDLRPHVDFVSDQGQIGSCTANAATKALSVIYERADDAWREFSRLYLYYWERKLENRIGLDGANPSDMIITMRDRGVCLETTYPYDITKADVEPPAYLDVEAAQYKISKAEQMPGNLSWPDNINWMKHLICQGKPILLTFFVHRDFETQGTILTSWKNFRWNYTTSPSNAILGSHETLIIGYDDVSQHLLVQNSWGPGWCDGGFFGIPYDYLDRIPTPIGGPFFAITECEVPIMPVAEYIPKNDLWEPSKTAVTNLLGANALNIQVVIDDLVANKIGKAQLETLMGWPTGTLAAYIAANQQYNWSGLQA